MNQPHPQRRQPRKRRRRPLFVLLFFALVAAVVLFALRQSGEPIAEVLLPIEEDEVYDGVRLSPVPLADITDTGYLKLVNRELATNRPIDYSYIVDAWPTVPVRATDVRLHRTALNAIAALFAEYPEEDVLFVTSGYRSEARQAEIYANAVDRMYVLPAGHSEHNLGLAADILAAGIAMSEMSSTPEALWLADNAWRHGLVLRYPYGTTHITGVAHEPWHFRYVGQVHAWYMHTHGMVLEQYLEFLEMSGGFTAELSGVTYHVMYHHAEGGSLLVPSDLQVEISQSNRGGFIITARE